MKKFDYIVVFFTLGLSMTVLFQNCSGVDSAKKHTKLSEASRSIASPVSPSLAPRVIKK